MSGAAALSPMGEAEKFTLREQRGRRALAEQPVRLGCQTNLGAVPGDVGDSPWLATSDARRTKAPSLRTIALNVRFIAGRLLMAGP